MKVYKAISTIYKIISVIFYCLIPLSILPLSLIGVIFLIYRPLLVIFFIWLFVRTIILIKKSFVSFSKGETAQGIKLLLAGILLPAGIVLACLFYPYLFFQGITV